MARVKKTGRLGGKERQERAKMEGQWREGEKEGECKVGMEVNKGGQESYARGSQGKKGG